MPAITSRQMGANHVVDASVCPGCGLTFESGDEHRPDCTVEPSPLLCEDCGAIRLPSEKSPVWRYDPNTHTYHCPNHQKGTTA